MPIALQRFIMLAAIVSLVAALGVRPRAPPTLALDDMHEDGESSRGFQSDPPAKVG